MRQLVAAYADKRLLAIFINGMASGFPWVIIGSALTLWLQDLGLTRTAIGFFGIVFGVYSLNWMWAPLLDGVRLPWLCRFGQRRSWLLLTQGLLLVFILLFSWVDPSENLVLLSLLALCVAVSSATQDIAIDAYRIEAFDLQEKKKISAAVAVTTSGWWAGYGFIGAIALYLVDFGASWNDVYFMMAFPVGLFIINTLLLTEPDATYRQQEQDRALLQYQNKRGAQKRVANWLLITIVQPIGDFFTRFGYMVLLILFFILFFKIGEAFLGRMSLVFYKEIGFSNSDIATYSKLIGASLTIVFSLLASVITIHYGLVRGLMIGGISMAAANLIFAYLAYVGPNTTIFATAIVVDNFTSALATVAFVSFISHLTNRAYTATQYALMSSMGNLGRTLFASGSGFLVDFLDGNWSLFFVITTLMVIPSLLMLYVISRKLRHLFQD